MTGEWIKLRAALMTDPKVMTIGCLIEHSEAFQRWCFVTPRDVTGGVTGNVTHNVTLSRNALRSIVISSLYSVWCAANEHARDGTVPSATLHWIDDICGFDGFGDAMASVQWASVSSKGLVFPKFDQHNTCNAERQRRFRAKKKKLAAETEKANETNSGASERVTSNVTGNVTSNVTASSLPLISFLSEFPNARVAEIPQSLKTSEFETTWYKWLRHVAHKSQMPSDIAQVQQLEHLLRTGLDKAIRDLEFSMLKDAKTIRDSSLDYERQAAQRPANETVAQRAARLSRAGVR